MLLHVSNHSHVCVGSLLCTNSNVGLRMCLCVFPKTVDVSIPVAIPQKQEAQWSLNKEGWAMDLAQQRRHGIELSLTGEVKVAWWKSKCM